MAEDTIPTRGRGPSLKDQQSEASEDTRFSEQTKAIVDRLKKDGELLRNKGKNSIRQVNIELSKFSDAFNAISDNIQNQSGILAGMQATAEGQAEMAKRERDFAELDENKESDTAKEIRLLREKADLFRAKNELKEAKGPGLGDLLGGLFSGGMLKNLAMIAGGGFIAYNLAKGFINKMTDGGFDRFVESVKNFDWSGLGTTIIDFMGSAKDGLVNMITFFDDPLKILAGLTGTVVGAKLLTSIGTSIAGKAIGSLVTGMPGAMSGAAGKGMGKAMMGALGAAGLIYAEDIAKFITGEAKNADIKNFNVKQSAATVGVSTAAGASIGMMFGPKGALVGAVAGFAYGLGKEVYDFIQDDILDKGILSNEAEDLIKARREREDLKKSLGDRYQEYVDALPEARRAKLISDDEFNERAQAELSRLDAEMAAAQEEFANRSIYIGNGRSKTLKSARRLEREQTDFDEKMTLLRQQREGLAGQLAGMDLDLTLPTPVLPEVDAGSTPSTAAQPEIETVGLGGVSPAVSAPARTDLAESGIDVSSVNAPVTINHVAGGTTNNVMNQNVQGGSTVATQTNVGVGGGAGGGSDVFMAVN